MPQADTVGRQINGTSAPHAQEFYAHLSSTQYPRGIDGPLFTRQVCGGANMNGVLLNPDEFESRNPLTNLPKRVPWQILADENIFQAWPGNPAGLNVHVDPPCKKGDAYRAGVHYRSKHNPELAPTASTIGAIGQAPGVTNIAGENEMPVTKVLGFMGKTLGKRIGAYKVDTSKFLKSHEKDPLLAFPTRFRYPDEEHKNPHPPKLGECPSNILHRNTIDFITNNKVDCLMSEPSAIFEESLLRSQASPSPYSQRALEKFSLSRSSHSLWKKRSEKTEEDRKLQEARRADFGALLRGQNPQSQHRQKRLNEIAGMNTTIFRKVKESLASEEANPRKSVNRHHEDQAVVAYAANVSDSRAVTTMSSPQSGIYIEYAHEGKTVRRMPKDDRRHLIYSLKRRWDEVNKEYQLLTLSLFNLDTVNKVTKKEACEELMMRLEKDIYRLSKGELYLAVEDLPTTAN